MFRRLRAAAAIVALAAVLASCSLVKNGTISYEQYKAIDQWRRTHQAQSGGDCYSGSPIPAWVVTRESHGNPFIYNTEGSGAFGCYQIMPSWWAKPGPDGCAHLNKWNVADQKACARIILRVQGPGAWGGF